MAENDTIELERTNVKNVSFESEDSLVYQAVKRDNPKKLQHLLTLGDFEQDTKSPNSIVLHSADGINHLLGLCVTLTASQCLYTLRTSKPGTSFKQDAAWLLEKARDIAEERCDIGCLFTLPDDDTPLEDLEPLMNQLIMTVHSVPAHNWVYDRINKDPKPNSAKPPTTTTDDDTASPTSDDSFHLNNRREFYRELIIQAGDPHSHPALLEDFIDKLPRAEWMNVPDFYDGTAMTPLVAAAHALNLPAMELLLSSGAHPFVGLDEDRKWLLENLLDTGANPLFRCVVQNIPPLWAKEPLSEPFGDGGLRAPDRDSATACMARMENAVRLIFDWFGQVRDEKERARWRVILESREFVEMLGVVGDAFVETVARWYLKTIRVRLTPEEQRSLLWSDEVDFETPYVWDPEWIPTADNEDEEIDSIFWRDGLSGRELLAVLKQKRLRLPGELRWMWARKILTPERLAQVEEDIKIERYDEEGIEDFELRDEECLFELVVRKRAFSTRDSYRSRSASIDSSDSGGPGEIIP